MSDDHEGALRTALQHDAATRNPLDPGEHLDADTLVAYHEGTLSAAAAARAQDHLVACAVCTGLLGDLTTGFAPEIAAGAAGAAATNFVGESEWRDFQRRLRESAPRAPSPPRPGPRAAIVPWALAAVLLATVAGLAWRVAQLGRETTQLRATVTTLEAPQTHVAMVYLDATTRDLGSVPTVTVDPARPLFLLILTPPIDQAGPYRVELYPAAGGSLHWSADDLTISDHGTVRIALSSRFLPAGDYRVRLLTAAGNALDERTLRVVKR